MGLICVARGCNKAVANCVCPPRAKRHWKAVVWTGPEGEKKKPKQVATRTLRMAQMTRQQAEEWAESLKVNVRENRRDVLPPDKRSIRDAIRAFLDLREAKVRAGERRPATLNNHIGICDNYLAPYFAHVTLSGITPAHVQKLCMELREGPPPAVLAARVASFEKALRGLGYESRGEVAVKERVARERERIAAKSISARTVRMIVDTLALVLDQAVLNEWVPTNAARAVPRDIKGKSKKRFPLTADEMMLVERFTRSAAAEDRLPVLLMAWCGLRRGECFGLQRRDFNRATHEVQVRRILDAEGLAGPVKSDSEGDVVVPDWLFEEIEAHLKTRGVVSLNRSDWLFTTRDGKPVRNNQTRFWETKVRPALVAAASDTDRAEKLKGATFHNLRHTYATLLQEKSAEAMSRKALMRHSTLQMTSEYTHPTLAAKRAAVAVLPVPDRCGTAAV